MHLQFCGKGRAMIKPNSLDSPNPSLPAQPNSGALAFGPGHRLLPLGSTRPSPHHPPRCAHLAFGAPESIPEYSPPWQRAGAGPPWPVACLGGIPRRRLTSCSPGHSGSQGGLAGQAHRIGPGGGQGRWANALCTTSFLSEEVESSLRAGQVEAAARWPQIQRP